MKRAPIRITSAERMGEELHLARRRAGLSQTWLSKKVGISQSMLSRFEARRVSVCPQWTFHAMALCGMDLLLVPAART